MKSIEKPPKKASKGPNLTAFCRLVGVDPSKRKLVARILKECGLNEPPRRVSTEIRRTIVEQVAARGQNRITQKQLDGDDAGTDTGATSPPPVARSDRSDRMDATCRTSLAEEKLRKTIAERELLEIRSDRNRKALLRLFTEKAILPRIKVAFAPMAKFLMNRLSKLDVREWNNLVELAEADLEAGLKEDADLWQD